MLEPVVASIVIPTYNGRAKIGACLDALLPQVRGKSVEILVVDDGSCDETSVEVLKRSDVRLITQRNAGPAAARNRGASEASGRILLFTDDDCVPSSNWLDMILAPFADGEVVAAKGVYRTRQRQLVARFVQAEYEDKYRLMTTATSIDFVDTYSAGFRRDRFLEMNGYDTSFPVACAEDVELSYRMSARGWLMKFVPSAIVFHTHPATLLGYLRKKYKFAFWRMYAVDKNPSKRIKDSHTPQMMKAQLLFVPALVSAILLDLATRPRVSCSVVLLGVFLLSTAPFTLRVARKDPLISVLSPLFLAARSVAQFLGVLAGIVYTWRHRAVVVPVAASLKVYGEEGISEPFSRKENGVL